LEPSAIPNKHEYQDLLSGTTTNRADYQQMLSDVQSGMFSHLGLYRVDRFGRNSEDIRQIVDRLVNQGVLLIHI
jgi:DNA invertase Pin-like site-specific DNA recombinase